MGELWIAAREVVDLVDERGTVAGPYILEWASADESEVVIGLRRPHERRHQVRRLGTTAADTVNDRLRSSDGMSGLAEFYAFRSARLPTDSR